ncbi:MAG TPA: M28 family peptidase [Chryseolinea sp.]|nr:M28 family peptidase [Chryseolinea sp.]
MRKLKLCVGFFILIIGATVNAQNSEIQKYGDRITATSLRDYLTILSSDAMEGRETGKRGQKMAAAFIRAHFEELGLIPPVNGDYYQTFELYNTRPGENYVVVGGTRINNFTDATFYGNIDSGGEVSVPLLFVGDGSEEALSQLGDLKDKAILLLAEAEFPTNEKLEALKAKGVKMIFISHSKTKADFDIASNQIRSFSGKRDLSLQKPMSSTSTPGVFIVSPVMTEKSFGLPRNEMIKIMKAGYKKAAFKKLKSVSIAYRTSSAFRPVKSENVLGYLEGSDKKDEVIVITAHYDHEGVKQNGQEDMIYNGADDDGSGTSAVMELARIFTQAKQEGKGPRRSILFMLVTAEEKGLLGSDYYTQNPVFPLENTVVNLNIDMIGRRDLQHQESAPYVYVIGADKLSTELNTVSETTNRQYTNLIFDYTYNDVNHPDRLYYRSDHWNFAKKNIPIIFYFDGIHEDYHKPSDEIEKIEFDLLTKRTQCIFYTAWEIANRSERIIPDQK